jgi:hypothetical protein
LNFLKQHGSPYLIAPPADNLNDISLSEFFTARKNNIKNPDFLPGIRGKIEIKKFNIGGKDSDYSDFLSPYRKSTFPTKSNEEDYDIIISSDEEGEEIKTKNKINLNNERFIVENEEAENSKNEEENYDESEESEERRNKNKDPDYEIEEEEDEKSEDNEELPKRKCLKMENIKKSVSQMIKRKRNAANDGNGYGTGLSNDLEKINEEYLHRGKKMDKFISNKLHGIAKKYFYSKNEDNAVGGFVNNSDIQTNEDILYNKNENQASLLNEYNIESNFNNYNKIIKKNEVRNSKANSPLKHTTCASENSKMPNSILFEPTGATNKSSNYKKNLLPEREKPISDDSDSSDNSDNKNNNNNSREKNDRKSPSNDRKGNKKTQ